MRQIQKLKNSGIFSKFELELENELGENIKSYAQICFSFFVIWSDWALLILNYKIERDGSCGTSLSLFGAGSLFGYVPLLSGTATLKRHDARRGLLLTTMVSSCILAAYDISEAMGIINNNNCKELNSIVYVFFIQVSPIR